MTLHKDDAISVAGKFRLALTDLLSKNTDFKIDGRLGPEDWENAMDKDVESMKS